MNNLRYHTLREDIMAPGKFRIVFTLYPNLTHLDFTGPHQVLCHMPNSIAHIASVKGGTVEAEGGLAIANTKRLSEIEACDLICAPGGLSATQAANGPDFIFEFKRLAATAKYITSVCTGSLILGAAGLLEGKRAACHWAWRGLLPLFGAIPDNARVVRDGNIFTGGGVTAGIDFAFTILAEVAGPEVAQAIQLGLEYAPEPPFQAGRPETAPPEVLARVRAMMERTQAQRRAEAQAAANSISRTHPAELNSGPLIID